MCSPQSKHDLLELFRLSEGRYAEDIGGLFSFDKFSAILKSGKKNKQTNAPADQSCRNFFIPAKLAPFDDRLDD